jgi:hypothetical protein
MSALGVNVDNPAVRERLAAAVHSAVCDYSGSDGFGHRVLYAIAGWGILLGSGESQNCAPQSGALFLKPDPSDQGGWLSLDPDNGPGELHAWIVRFKKPVSTGLQEIPPDTEIIDFSARHYRDLVERMPRIKNQEAESVRRAWLQAAPSSFLWQQFCALPSWVRFVCRANATQRLIGMLRDHKAVCRLATRYFVDPKPPTRDEKRLILALT